MKRLIITLSTVFLLFLYCGKTDHSMVVKQGRFQAVITETGELQAISSKVINSPASFWEYGQPKVIDLVKEGTIVQKGDFIGQLDTSGVTKIWGQRKIELASALADLETLHANQTSKKKVTQSELQSARAALRTAQIDTQRVTFESQAKKDIAKLRYRMEEIDFRRIQNKIKHTVIIQAEEIKIQNQKIERLKREITKAENAMAKYTLYAPSKGLIEYPINRRSRQKIRVGDNIGFGDAILKLPDLSKMKAKTCVNETDIDKISLGQKVFVTLDAFPKKIFDSSIIKISSICKPKEKKSKIKIFEVEVSINGSDPILRPGMTVSCEIVVSDIQNALYVAHQCIHKDELGYFVMVDRGSGPEKVKIKLGPKNSKNVVVIGNLKSGDKIIANQNLGNV